MPKGSKDGYTDKQKRQAEHIEKGYEKHGISKAEAEEWAWRTVNKTSGGAKKPGGSGVKKAAVTRKQPKPTLRQKSDRK